MIIRKDVLKLTLPIIAEQALIMLMGVINAVMAGRIGKEAVSAIGMVDSLNNMFIALVSALAVGGTVVVAQYTGQENSKNANEAARQSMFSGVLLASAITLATWVFRYPVLTVLYGSAEQNVMNNAHIYLGITLLTYPLIAVTTITCGVLRGAGDTGTPMKITVFMNFLNILFSYLFIYGIHVKSPYFNINLSGMGIAGAATGIALARTIGAVISIFVLLRGSKIIKLTDIRSFKLDMAMQKAIFGIGIPASVESLLFNGGKLITQIYIVSMGTVAIASNYIANSIFSIINIPGGAFSIAATTLVGQCMGRGESEEAKNTLIYLTKSASLCLLVLCTLFFPFSGLLASMYTQDQDVISLAAYLIRLSSFSMPAFWAVSFVLPAGLKGAGDAKYTMMTSIIGMWVFRITLGYILGIPLKMGIAGVWTGMYVDWLVRGTLYCFRLKSGKWKRKVVVGTPKEAVL